MEILDSDSPLFAKIEKLVTEYIDTLNTHKFIPAFILHELNRNPDRIFENMQESGIKPQLFIEQFASEIKKGNIRPMDPRHLIVNIIALCVFPIAAQPLLQRIFFNNDALLYQQFLEDRKKTVTSFIMKSIHA